MSEMRVPPPRFECVDRVFDILKDPVAVDVGGTNWPVATALCAVSWSLFAVHFSRGTVPDWHWGVLKARPAPAFWTRATICGV